MKKIVHVITDSGIGGAGMLLINLFRHIDRSRYEIVLILPKGSLLALRACEIGIRYVEPNVHADCSFCLSDLPTYVSLLEREKPDILHTHACLTARLAGLAVGISASVDTKHCAYAPSAIRRILPMKAAARVLDALCGTRHIATAEAAKEVLLAEGISTHRIDVVCGGSEPVKRILDSEKSTLRASVGLSADDFVVGFAARLEPGKGHETLIAAARELAECPNIRFLIVGCGSRERALRKMARGLTNVIFLGFRADIGRVMQMFDLNVNCSYLSETSSLALSEGMSLGLPLVVTDCGGNEAMARGCGLVVPPENAEAFALAIMRLWKDRALYESLSREGERRFFTSYTAETMAKKTCRIYESLSM